MIKPFIFLLGASSLILGIIGIFLPVLPTTPFLLLAAWCFLKSSPHAHAWLYRQPLFGKILRDWEEHHAISPRAKAVALSMIVASVILIWIKVKIPWIAYSVTALLAGVSAFIVTRKNV